MSRQLSAKLWDELIALHMGQSNNWLNSGDYVIMIHVCPFERSMSMIILKNRIGDLSSWIMKLSLTWLKFQLIRSL